jgi:hypothetical protein
VLLVTTPELTVTPTEYVNRFAAQLAGLVMTIVGKELTVTGYIDALAAIHPLIFI